MIQILNDTQIKFIAIHLVTYFFLIIYITVTHTLYIQVNWFYLRALNILILFGIS